MINLEIAIASAFMLGLASSTHCVGMCGGIAAAFGLTVEAQGTTARLARIFAYNSGRIFTYMTLGFLVAGFAAQWMFIKPLALFMRLLAGVMLIAMACYIGQWWMGLTRIEQMAQRLWRYIQPLSAKLLPLQSIGSAFVFGMLWGFLPCGLVYSMLVWVAGRGEAIEGGILMLSFGIGTLPALVFSGVAAQQLKSLIQAHLLRQSIAALLAVFGVWTLYTAIAH